MARKIDLDSIPQDWKYDLLDKFAVRCSGHTPSQSYPEYWNGGIKWISLADSRRLDSGYIFETDKEISEEGLKNSSAELHPAETVVLSRDAGIGKSAVMSAPMAVSQHFIAWKCDNTAKLHSWFLYNWLQLNKTEFERQAVGSTIKTIGLPYFKKLKIAVPPFSEQKKIAQILSTWDQAISATEQLLIKSQQQKKALMQQLLTGKKRLLDENGKVFNSEWLIFSVNQIGRVVTGSTPPKEQMENYGGEFDWATAEDFQGKYINDTNIKLSEIGMRKVRLLSKGAVLVTCIASIGKNAIAKKEMATNQQINAVEVNEFNSNEFFYYLIEFNVNKLRTFAGTTAVAILNKSTFEKVKFQMPPLQEQRKIAELISMADQEIEALQRKLDCLKQEKKALMQQLLTGKKRVKVAA